MDDSRSDVTPSIAELYKSAANPMRTDFNRVHVDDTPFVSSRGSRRSRRSGSQGSQGSQRSRDNRTQASRTTVRSSTSPRAEKSPVLFNESLFDQPAEEDPVKTYVSRRSTTSSARVRSIKHHPLIQGERQAEKKMFLQEINRMRDAGATTTRMYTDEDSLADIEFEHNRIKCNEEQISAVNFMKDMIKLGATGIELANSKFKLLRLNRWSADVTSDMERYNRPLSKIYQRYWRKGSVSPFVELAFLLFGGLIFHHFKNVLFGVGGNQPPPQQQQHAPPNAGMAPPSRNVPFSMPSQQAPAPNGAKRRTMRRPKRAPAPMQAQKQSAPVSPPSMPTPNLINMLLPKQVPVNLPQQPVPSASSIHPTPVVVIDVQQKGRRRRGPEPTLEIIEEDGAGEEQPSSPHHVIDVLESKDPEAVGQEQDDAATVLSFDMA